MSTRTPRQHGGGKPAAQPRTQAGASASDSVMSKLRAQLATPQLNYLVIMSVTLLLTVLGLTMVLSSSMVTSYASANSVWGEFIKQGAVVVVGLVAMWVSLRISPRMIKRLAPFLLVAALALLGAVLIPGVGTGGTEVGSNSWIRLGPVGIQPSEVAKLALAVWGSAVLSDAVRKDPRLSRSMGLFIGLSGAVMLLILAQKDLGMMFAVGIVIAALFFFSGVNTRVIAMVGGVVAVVGVLAIMAQSFRSARITTWLDALTLNFSEHSTQGDAYQSYQGILSLSDGGLLGTGLGQSRAKWFYLPEAKNDFIFAVIGEELGLAGAAFVVLLFAILGWFGIRTARQQVDPFLKLLAATLTVGVVVQAFFNMGYVVGFLPVTGIQLPLISAGGSSAIITLMTLGLLANCARHEPETISSMQYQGRPALDRMLFLPEPQPYRAGEKRREQRRQTTRTYGKPVTQRTVSGQPSLMSQDVRRDRDRQERLQRRAGGGDTAPRRYDRNRRHDIPSPAQRDRSSHRNRRP